VKRRDPEGKTINLLDLIPVRTISWERNEKGLIVLLKPKFRHPFIVKHFLSRLRKPHYRINLDSIGSYVWEQCDGNRSVKEVAENMGQEFGEKVEPLYDRLTLFLQSLEKNHFIYYKGLQGRTNLNCYEN